MTAHKLALGQTAEPHTCGSCFFFGRRGQESYLEDETRKDYMPNHGGYCKFKLPPHAALREQGEGAPSNWTRDDDRCDLWRKSEQAFIVSRVV